MASRSGRAKRQQKHNSSSDPTSNDPRPLELSRPSRWQLTVSGTLLLCWILFLAWIAMNG